MSRARSVSQLVGANTALGNTVITGTANVSSTLGTNGSITVTTSGIPELKVRSTSTTGSRGANVTLQVDSTGGDDPAGAINFFTGSGQVGSIQATSGGSGVSGQLYINLANTSNTVRQVMKIDTEGRMTLPYQPFFEAYRGAPDQTGFNAASTGDVVVVFNTVITNTGNHYNSSTGKFTAPVAGTYAFQAGAYLNFNASQSWLVLNGNRAVASDWNFGTTGAFTCGFWIIKLAANDTVGYHPYYGTQTNGTIYINANHTYFRGCLLG